MRPFAAVILLTACFAVLLCCGRAVGQEVTSDDLALWGESLPTDSRIIAELQRFVDDAPLSRGYASAVAREVRSRVFTTATEHLALLLDGECIPRLDVTIGVSPFASASLGGLPDAERRTRERFEGSVIRTEMVACLETEWPDPVEVLELYTSAEFRMAAESRIDSMWIGDQGTCLETRGVYALVDPTLVCNRIESFASGMVAAQHSQVVLNEGSEPYQDVYFKESLKTFVRIPGGMALHYINYTRAAGMSRLSRWVAEGKISESQEGNIAEFQRWLSR